MPDQKQAEPPFEVMSPDVFVGGCGHIVVCQEWTTAKGEEYTRVLIQPRTAEAFAMKILAAAKKARGE
jgi:hypothetical protein